MVTNTEKKQRLSGALAILWYRTKVEEQKELLGGIGGKKALFLWTTLSLKNLNFHIDMGAEERSVFQ